MSKITLEITCSNDAFGESPDSYEFGVEVARILRSAADKFESGYARFPLKDSNGNTVGTCGLVTEE